MDQDEIAIEREKLAIEREKLTIEQAKAGIEGQKVAIEEKKLAEQHNSEEKKLAIEEKKLAEERKRTWSTVVSVAVAAAAIYGSVWAQSRTAMKAFDTKVAEIVMNATDPEAAQNKCEVLKTLYPQQLSNVVCRISLPGASSPLPAGDTDVETKKEFFKLLAAKENDPHKLVMAWKAIFPGDKWIDALDSAARPH